ncbi:Uncharacterized protein LSUE1_G006730 [Lachnellula suecica]|uniref:Thioesterase domain-containing protein n=1 Tax=Lachnellula suecica TaxID=602035 RepID=A0A8T9BZ01_9HELO|nr:Uncharacterized protein LSUE1_G006730 [Lachnellula suecica]
MITRLPTRLSLSSATSRSIICPSRRCLKAPKRPAKTFQALRCRHTRNYSTSSPPPPPPPASPPPSSDPAAEPKKPIDLRSQLAAHHHHGKADPPQKYNLRPLIYATIVFMIGSLAGQYTSLIVAPPALPEAGSKEDKLMVKFLTKKAESLPIVQSLSTDPEWISYDAYSNLSEEERKLRITSGPLAGARAVGGFQRVFYNKDTGEIVTVIWLGGAVSGWPGVVHGGLTSTIMDEALRRCAVKNFPAKTGVTANLEVIYLKPVVTNDFYVVRSLPQAEGQTDNKIWVNGRLETLQGAVCVEAKALYVVPKKFKTRVISDNF